MAFVTTGNGHIVSEMLSRNKLAGGKRAKEWSALNMNGSGPHG
jgi:hypothetical protein